MKKILVIDGNSIINRAFYGVKPLTTKTGKFTNAIYGMINIISKQMNALKPDYAAVAFDLKAPTFRHKMYDGYKQGRHPTPPELLSQFNDAKICLSLMGLKVMEIPGYEADDIQGTVASLAHKTDGVESYILTGDRDLLQLIDDKITVLLATNTDTVPMHREEFRDKYGVEPELFIDMKALMGDSSDNIPGVGGIGEKTASSLVSKFGTLEAIYDSIDDPSIKAGVREKLLRDREMAFLSKKLVTIDKDAPIGMALDELAFNGPDRAGLYRKFTELELGSLIVKFGLAAADAEEARNAVSKPSEECFTEIAADALISKAAKRIALAEKDGKIYAAIGDESFKIAGSLDSLGDHLVGKEIVCFGAKSLIHSLRTMNITTDGAVFLDLQLYAYVINPGGKEADLPSLFAMFTDVAPSNDICPRALLTLEEKMRERIERDELSEVLFNIEIPLINVLADIEHNGFKIDPKGILEFGEALEDVANELAERIYMQAGREFNINSPKQLGEVLYVDLGLEHGKKNKSGYSTDAQTLEELRSESPIIDDILEYRQVTKLRSTYTTVLVDAADEENRIHTDFKQALTATGRLSSAEPNLQNIPIRTKLGRELRRYFIAKEGCVLVDADYSQIELRLLAHISGDYTMTEAFKKGEDIHRKTASAVFGVPEESVTEDMRKRAKAVNFGIVYGISGFSLAKEIGTTAKEATRYIKNYLMNYPSIDSYLSDVTESAKELGYTSTLYGRRRYIPELRSQNGNLRAFGKRVAMNAPIQGSAADIMKIAMIRVAKRLEDENLGAKIVMQVHDEIVVECPIDKKDRCMAVVKEEMENAANLSVPFPVDVTYGTNWLEQN